MAWLPWRVRGLLVLSQIQTGLVLVGVLLREIQFLTEYDVLYRNYAHCGGQGIAGCSQK